MLTRYWFRFKDLKRYSRLTLGCGITAYDQGDAIEILRRSVFERVGESPEIAEIIPEVDISELDQRHIIPNMESPVVRGVWFPRGF